MSSPSPKRLLYSHFAALARGLGHERRLELIEHLGQGERSVEALAERTGLAFANVSQHLQQLRRLGVVTARRDGKHVLYRLADAPVVEALTALRRLAEHSMAEVRETVSTYFSDAMEPVSQNELMVRLNDGTATLLDVRPGDEFGLGHLPGAVNIDLDELEARLAELPRDRQVVAYCRGSYCVLSYQAVQLLRSRGFDARRLEDGFPEWKARGRPVETGAA